MPVAPAVGDRPSIGDGRQCRQSGRPADRHQDRAGSSAGRHQMVKPQVRAQCQRAGGRHRHDLSPTSGIR